MSTVANKANFVDTEFISASIKIFLPKSGVKVSCQLPWNDPTAKAWFKTYIPAMQGMWYDKACHPQL